METLRDQCKTPKQRGIQLSATPTLNKENRNMKKLLVITLASLAIFAIGAQAQVTSTTTMDVQVNVQNEAKLTAGTATCVLSKADTTFGNWTSSGCNFNAKFRTTKVGGSGQITAQVTTPFSGTG